MNDRIDEAYRHCAEITRRRARNFYYGLRLTPEPKRSAIYSVYAWMRSADDQVDEAAGASEKRTRLDVFASATARLLDDADLRELDSDPVWLAFRETVRRYRIDPADLRKLIEGLELDLQHEIASASHHATTPALICATRDDLERYCYAVASTVGLVCITIWGIEDSATRKQARALAIQRGLAFQLTNILRDFVEDFDDGRVYLPQEDLELAGLDAHALRHWSDPGACAGLVSSLAHWAQAQYEESAPLDLMIDAECRPAIRTMTRIYGGLLDVIQRDPRRIVGARRIRLQSARKAQIAISSIVGHWMRRPHAASETAGAEA